MKVIREAGSLVLSALTLCATATGLTFAAEPATGSSTEQGKSVDEIARELANPNNSLANITFKNQYRWYKGDLPNADNQQNYTLLFQPVFPFPLTETESGGVANLFVRPGVPLLVDQPVFDPSRADFTSATALGDIGFDVGLGVTEKSGVLWAFGMVGTLPTATKSDVAGKQLRLGPEFLLGKFEKWGVYGIFPSHQWNVTSASDRPSYSASQVQAVLKFLPGGGWNVGTAPIMNYDWKSRQWTIPLNLSISRTVKFGSTPVKLELELNYYVQRPDAFGPQWMIAVNISPVVNNFINDWIRGR